MELWGKRIYRTPLLDSIIAEFHLCCVVVVPRQNGLKREFFSDMLFYLVVVVPCQNGLHYCSISSPSARWFEQTNHTTS